VFGGPEVPGQCWAKTPHQSKTYRLAYEVKAKAVDTLDPLKREYEVQLKHDNMTKLLKVLYQPVVGLKVEQFVTLVNNKSECGSHRARLSH